MSEQHRLPASFNRELLKQETPPVSIQRPADWISNLRSIITGQRNLLAIWPDRAYRALSLKFKLLNQPYLVCNSPDTVRRVFLDEHDNYDRKSPQMRHALEPLLGDGLFVSDGELWKERRAYCAPAFEKELLPDFAQLMTDSAREVADRWAQLPADSPVDMLNEMARLTARIIGRTVFGDETSDAEAAQVVRGFSEYQRQIDQLSIADSFGLPFLRWLTNPLQHLRCLRAGARVQAVIDRIIQRQQHAPQGARLNLMQMFLEGHTGARSSTRRCPLHPTAARNEAIVMFMAGHETTANALAWAWYLLDHNPRVAACLHAELDQVLGGRPPTLDDVPNLPYTRAVFEETMRLYPPVPVLSRQARQADVIRERDVEPGAIILTLPWLLHRHELFWEAPEHFVPERFMPGQPRPDKFIYLPFSVGHRVCLGLRFGLTEGILCLATLAQRFRAQVAPGHQVAIECRLTLRPQGGLPMLLQPRQA
ncbi:cytochrome P450 [Zoogloea sp.]|uniref:cytochrome P450 n=1 Tax=Zoogloea sp. TaxID=49181 RepID=UPI0035B270FF